MAKTNRSSVDISSAEFRARAERRRATWTINRYRSLDEMKRDEYRYWVRRPGHERLAAGAELSRLAYAMKGEDVQELRRTLIRLKR
jgi:hypothetical protein